MAAVQKEGPSIVFYLQITNQTPEPLTQLAVKFDNNPYKLQPTNMSLSIAGVNLYNQIAPGAEASTRVLLDTSGTSNGQPPAMPFKVQVAMNSSFDVFVFSVPISFSVFLVPTPACSQAEFNDLMSRPNQVSAKESFVAQLTEDQIKQKMINNNVNFVFAQRNENAGFSRIR